MATEVKTERDELINQIGKLNIETLRILADLSKKPGIEKKLKDNLWLIKKL